jgi:hypothetical protein
VFQRQNIIRNAAKVTGPVVPGFFAERKADHSVSGVRVGEDCPHAQLLLSQVPKFIFPAFGLAGFLPKLIRSRFNFFFGGFIIIIIVASIAWMVKGAGNQSLARHSECNPSHDQRDRSLALAPKIREGSEKLGRLFAKPVAAQERLIDRDARLRALSYGNRNKKNVARHVAGHINARDAGLASHRVGDNAALLVALCSRGF